MFTLPTNRRLLKEIIRRLDRLEERMTAELARLTQEVTEMSDVVDSAKQFIGNIAQMLRDAIAANDPAALAALADTLDTKATELTAAIVANTPEG